MPWDHLCPYYRRNQKVCLFFSFHKRKSLLKLNLSGPRRDMLHSQIKEWMEAAESIKGFLENKDNELGDKTLDEDHHACVLQ